MLDQRPFELEEAFTSILGVCLGVVFVLPLFIALVSLQLRRFLNRFFGNLTTSYINSP